MMASEVEKKSALKATETRQDGIRSLAINIIKYFYPYVYRYFLIYIFGPDNPQAFRLAASGAGGMGVFSASHQK